MTNPIIKIVSETGEELERAMTAKELAEYENGKAELDSINSEIKAKLEAKAELFARLGITAEEAELLLS